MHQRHCLSRALPERHAISGNGYHALQSSAELTNIRGVTIARRHFTLTTGIAEVYCPAIAVVTVLIP